MIDWVFILTPLAVLPIVLLFRFVGCGLNAVGQLEEIPLPHRNPPRYRDYILADPSAPPGGVVQHYDVTPNRADVIGYWRLIDAKPGPAADEKGFQAGEYVEVAQQIQEALSDTGPGPGLVDPSQLSLIESDPQVRCRTFVGGCMRVVNRPELFPVSFTIEAWVSPRWSAGGFEHTLFSAGNPGSAAPQGFALYANEANKWVIRLASFGVLTLDQAPPLVSLTAKAHIALTVEAQGSGRLVRLFIDGNPAGKTLLVTYDAPAGWDLLIGAANRAANPGSLEISRPFIGQIQEVVLHKKALSAKELQNHVAINQPLK